MTKIGERVHWDNNDKTIIMQERHDFNPVLEKAKALKSSGLGNLGNDNKLAAVIPVKMWEMWAKKWGVSVSDTAAMKEVVARELMDSNNAHLRVWDGKF